MIKTKYYFQKGFASAGIILPIIGGLIVVGGITGALLYFNQPSGDVLQQQQAKGSCGDGICQPIEKLNGICAEDCQQRENNGFQNKPFINNNQFDNNQPKSGSCGDGICQNIEKTKGICPQDCGQQEKVPAPTQSGGSPQGNKPSGSQSGNQTTVNTGGNQQSGNTNTQSSVGSVAQGDVANNNNNNSQSSVDLSISGNTTQTTTQTQQQDIQDITAPILSSGSPSGTLSIDTTSAQLSLATNENAICKYSSTPDTNYFSISNIFSTTGGTSHQTIISNLLNGQSYAYYVRCQDASGNTNIGDYLITFNIAAPSAASNNSSNSSSFFSFGQRIVRLFSQEIIPLISRKVAQPIGSLFGLGNSSSSKPLPQNQSTANSQQLGSCGDGICQDIEKTKGICPQDCGQQASGALTQSGGGATTTQSGGTTKKPSVSQQGSNASSGSGQSTGSAQQASAAISEINFHQLATGKKFGDLLKLFNPVIDEANKKLYAVGSKTTNVGVVDLTTDQFTDVFDVNVMGGFLIFNSNKLYSYQISSDPKLEKCYEIDVVNKKASEVSTCKSMLPAKPTKGKEETLYWGNYSFKRTGYQSFSDGTTGFPTDWRQDLNAAYGVLEIYDASNNKKGEIVFGPDALYPVIDQTTGKLYTTNTGDGSISIFDLNKLESTNFCQNNSCKIKDIDIGNSADEVIVDSAGNVYLRNRLGGSVIYKYNKNTKKLIIIDNENHAYNGIGMWPTDIELSKDEKTLYVLSHYDASIDAVDAQTNTVINKIKFTVDLKPRTDSISAMTMDKSRGRLYATWPELGIVGIADGINNKVIGTIDLTKYGFDRATAANGGPGLVNLAVNEKTNKLYIYLYKAQKLLVFNGDTLAKEAETSVSLSTRSELSLMSNDDSNTLYLGNKMIDETSLKETGAFSKDGKVVAFNNNDNSVYLTGKLSVGMGRSQEKIYKYVNNILSSEWTLDRIGDVQSRFWFDFGKNVFYVAYFESGMVKEYDLTKGSAPSSSGSSGSINKSGNTNNVSSGSSGSSSCDLNKDGKVDTFEQNMCGGKTSTGSGNATSSNTTSSSSCDLNKDGKVDTFEQNMCGKIPGGTQ